MQGSDTSNLKRPVDTADGIKGSTDKRVRLDSDPPSDDIQRQPSNAALLYNLAHGAWQASNRHLTQAFIPVPIGSKRTSELPPIRIRDPLKPSRVIDYRHDPLAGTRAAQLSLVALDALAFLLKLPDLSDKERVTAGLLFGKVALGVLQAHRSPDKLNESKLDYERLLADVQTQLAVCVSLWRTGQSTDGAAWHSA